MFSPVYFAPGWVNVAVIAIADNGSAEAASAFEALLRDTGHDVDTRIAWLHSDLVRNRDKLALLAMARRLLDGPVAVPIKTAIGEALFDYRQDWYDLCPGPPKITGGMYGADARRELRAIAATIRARKPDKRLAAAIATTLAEFDAIERKP